jgi:hypothetical protein
MTAALPMPTWLLFLAALLTAPPVIAQSERVSTCGDEVENLLRKALAAHADTRRAASGTRLQLDCVAVPGDANGSVHALGSFRDDATRSYNDGGDGEGYAFVLATLDAGNRLRHHVTATAIQDATTLFVGGEFTLDTGFHDLAPGGGVVGVAVTSAAPGASAPDNRWRDEFALFVPDGTRFRRVLGLARQTEESIEGCVSGWCTGSRWTETTATLTPGELGAEGWRRIEIRLDVAEIAIEPAVARTAPTSTTATLAYANGEYRLPDGGAVPGSGYFFLLPW